MTRTGEPLNIYLSEDRAVIEEIVTGKILGSVSFDEDELYYVILPLLDDPSVEVHAVITKTETIRKRGNRMHVEIELTIPKSLKDIPAVNGSLIKALLK